VHIARPNNRYPTKTTLAIRAQPRRVGRGSLDLTETTLLVRRRCAADPRYTRSPFSPFALILVRVSISTAILVFDDVQIIDYTGPYEALGRRGDAYLVAEKPDGLTTNMACRSCPITLGFEPAALPSAIGRSATISA